MGKVQTYLIYLSGELESLLGACHRMGYVWEKVPNRALRVSIATDHSIRKFAGFEHTDHIRQFEHGDHIRQFEHGDHIRRSDVLGWASSTPNIDPAGVFEPIPTCFVRRPTCQPEHEPGFCQSLTRKAIGGFT
jgi:hypothetical protein